MASVLNAGAGVVAAVVATSADRAAAAKGSGAQQWGHASLRQRGASQARLMVGSAGKKSQKLRAVVVVKAAGDGVEIGVETKRDSADVFPNHEWPENFSLLNFEDLISHFEPTLFKKEAQPGTYLADIMSKTLYTAFPEQNLSEVTHFFAEVTGFPVVNEGYEVVGVVSKKDRAEVIPGQNPKVKDIMSSPAITLSADKTVQDAAVLMLKNKIHRIPIVNASAQVVGIVTRTDIFTALDSPKLS